MNELLEFEVWLKEALVEASVAVAGGVHRGIAPGTAAYPHVIIALSEGDVVNVLNSSDGNIGMDAEYLIKVVDSGTSLTRSANLAESLRLAMLAKSGEPNSRGVVVSTRSLRPFLLPVSERDQIFQQIGHFYRVHVESEAL